MADLANVFGYIIAAFLGLIGVAILYLILTGKIDLSQLISEPTGEASMSRFQLLIFTFVVSFSMLYVIFKKDSFPTIPESILGILGISGGTYVISKGIQTSRDTTMQKQAADTATTDKAAAYKAAADKAAAKEEAAAKKIIPEEGA